jgi:hypothetical protein
MELGVLKPMSQAKVAELEHIEDLNLSFMGLHTIKKFALNFLSDDYCIIR